MSLARVSVGISNKDYARFLPAAIDSALGQEGVAVEVVVVDDGSGDGSPEVIAGYGGRVRALLQENRGQTSAINAGFAASRGDIVVFLDADDTLYPAAAAVAAGRLREPVVAKVHWPLAEVDAAGRPTGRLWPRRPLPEGSLAGLLLQAGPDACEYPPTSGNAWARRFLERVMPLPEVERGLGLGSASADACLAALAPLHGRVAAVGAPQGTYRLHGGNDFTGRAFAHRHRHEQLLWEHRARLLAAAFAARGEAADVDAWRRGSWSHRLGEALETIAARVPGGRSFILADREHWGLGPEVGGRPRVPFPEKDGVYQGRPRDSAAAVAELERLRRTGHGFLVLAWTAFSWRDEYPGLFAHLDARHRLLLADDQVAIWDLTSGPARGEAAGQAGEEAHREGAPR